VLAPRLNRNPEELLEAVLPDISQAVGAACCHYGVDQDEIDDFYQEIVLFLIEDDSRRLRSFQKKSSPKTWLTAIALHHISNHVSRQRKAISLDEISDDLLVCNPSQESELITGELESELREAVRQLTARERQLFRLLCRDDLNSSEIATRMAIKADSVRRRKHALIKKLRQRVNSPGRRSRRGAKKIHRSAKS